MANGAELLPQSALSIGQTPLATIQAPNVPVSIPNPMDVSNFFRMQQGMQNNAGILQNAEQLRMQRQEMDMRNYENSIKEMDNIMGMVNESFSDFYNQKTAGRNKNSAASSPLYSGLDPTRARHQEATRRVNSIIDAAEAKADQLGKSFLSSGAMDPASQFEVSRGIQSTLRDAHRDISQDAEFFELSRMHQAYNQWLDKLALAEKNGANINAAAVDKLEKEYNQWTEDGSGNININKFNIDDFLYDGGSALKRMAGDAERLGKGIDEFEEVGTQGGGVFEGNRVTKRSLSDITDAMSQKYMDDRDAVALFNNTVKGRQKPDGTPYEFKDWIRDLSAPYAPVSGKESVISNLESVIIKPGSDETNPSSGGARTGSTAKGSSAKGDNNRGLINVLGRDPKDVNERDITMLGNNVQELGFDVTKANTDLTPYDWSKLARLDDKNRLEIVEVDIDGKVVPRGKGDYLLFSDKGYTNSDGVVEIPKEFIVEFPRANKTREGVGAVAPGQGSVYRHELRDDAITSTGNDRGSANNNPGNLRATKEQIDAGVPVDDKGFVKFDTLKEGVEVNMADIDYKLAGKSDKFQANNHLIKKYGKEALAPDKYLDVATVEDLMRVRTPVIGDGEGADNTPEEFENFIKHLEKRGFPRDMKIKDLKDSFNFNASIFEVESPDAYRRAFDKGGVMPSAHDGEIIVEEDNKDVVTAEAKARGFSPAKKATLSAEGLARNTLDRIITNDEEISEEELQHFFENPPEELKDIVDVAANKWAERSKSEDEYKRLLAKQELVEQVGQELSDDEERKLRGFEEQGFGTDESLSVQGLGKIIRSEIARELEPKFMQTAIENLVSEDGLSPGESQDFTYKGGRFGNTKQGISILKSYQAPDTYGVITFSTIDGVKKNGSVQMMNGDEVQKLITGQLSRFDEESALRLLNPEKVNAQIMESAGASLKARQEELAKRQAQLDGVSRGANDVNMREKKEAADKKVEPKKDLKSKWF